MAAHQKRRPRLPVIIHSLPPPASLCASCDLSREPLRDGSSAGLQAVNPASNLLAIQVFWLDPDQSCFHDRIQIAPELGTMALAHHLAEYDWAILVQNPFNQLSS